MKLVSVSVVGRDPAGGQDDLPDGDPLARVGVDQGAQPPQEPVGRLRIVQHDVGEAGALLRVVRQGRVLADQVDDVDAEAVDASVEPEPQDVVHRLPRPRGFAQFRSGCSGRKQCR